MTKETIYIGVCPECGSLDVVPIFRGYPSPEIRERVKSGKAVWGGCSMADEAPNWLCRECEYVWHED